MFHVSGLRLIRALSIILLGALALAGLALRANAASFTINLAGDSACTTNGTNVAAVVFGTQGPDPSKTVVVNANSSGVATFSGLTTTDKYQFLASNTGCTPSVRDQAMDPSNVAGTIADGGSKTITLNSNSSVATLKINLTLPGTGTFPKLVFGGCKNGTSSEDTGFGFTSAAAATTGIITLVVPPAAANTYNCGVFSPSDNKGGGSLVSSALTAGGPPTTVNIDLTQFGAPVGTQTQANRNGTQGGGGQPNLSVQVTKQSDGSAVSQSQLRLKTSTTGNPINIVFTDFNGVGSFFGLINNTSYYLDIVAPALQGVTNRLVFSANWISSPVSISTPLAAGTVGTITGTVTLSGVKVPQLWVNCNPDFNMWNLGTDEGGGIGSNPGAGFGNTNASDGTFSIGNLSPGNYQCWVNSPFSNQPTKINDGQDAQGVSPSSPLSTALRLLIDPSGVFKVRKSSDGSLVSSGQPVSVVLKPPTTTADGTVTQTYVFPTTGDIGQTAVIFHENFSGTPGQQPKSAFGVLTGVGPKQILTVKLPTKTKYYREVRGSGFGPVSGAGGGFDAIDLTNQTSVTLPDQLMAAAGTAHVTVVGPDGGRFIPSNGGPDTSTFCNGQVNAIGQNVPSFQSSQLNSDGTADIAGLPAGVYNLKFQPFGSGCTVAPGKAHSPVTIDVNKTVNATINLQKGVALEVNVTGSLPAGVTPQTDGGKFPNPNARVMGFPRGTVFNLSLLRQFLGFGDDDAPYLGILQTTKLFPSNKTVTVFHGFGNPNQPDVVPPGDYAFLAMVQTQPTFDPGAATGSDPGAFAQAIGGIVNAPVSSDLATNTSANYGSKDVLVNLPVTFGDGTVKGKITLTRFIQKSDFEKINGDFNKFTSFLPACALYKNSGTSSGSGIPVAFGMAIPNQVTDSVLKIEGDVAGKDFNSFASHVSSVTLAYKIPFVPAGTYTEVCQASAYPPVVQSVTVTAGTATVANIDFDKQAGPGGTISGVVSDASGKLSGASVTLKTKSETRTATTDSSGAYQITGLPDGVYRIFVTYPGDAIGTNKATISAASSATANFTLTTAAAPITGAVIAATFPNIQKAAQAPVVAVDAKFRGDNPGLPPPVVFTQTGDDGTYSLTGFIAGETIKICAYPDGKQVTCVNATAASTAVAAADIVLTSQPPVPTVQVRPGAASGTVDARISIPKILSAIPTLTVNAGTTFNSSGATAVPAASVVSAPTTSGSVYNAIGITLANATGPNTIRVTATDGNSTQTIDTVVDPTKNASSCIQTVDRHAVTGGSVSVDADNAGAGSLDLLDPLSVVASSDKSSVATASMVKGTTSTITTSTSTAIVGVPYKVTLSTAAQIATGTSLTITLPLNGATVDPKTLVLAQIVNGAVQKISCTPVVNPLAGTVSCDVLSIGSAASAPSLISGSQHSPSLMGMAMFDGEKHVYDAASSVTQTGDFVLLSAAVQGSTYAGNTLNTYNFPNPFNLQTKTLTLANGGTTASITTTGTIIRYDLPTGSDGQVIIRIYDLAGELVKVIDDGSKTSGSTYYTTWDGTNLDGAQVASGVYFAIFDVPGQVRKDHVVKMAVVK